MTSERLFPGAPGTSKCGRHAAQLAETERHHGNVEPENRVYLAVGVMDVALDRFERERERLLALLDDLDNGDAADRAMAARIRRAVGI
jgi:hypothetical protein